MPRLILASSSEARRRMLAAAGLTFDTAAARIDAPALRAALDAEGAAPRDVADALAEAKALKVSARNPGALVIGADQVLDLDREIFPKAGTPEELRAQLARLAGRGHRLHSAAVAAEDGEPIWRHVGEARLHVRSASDRWLDEYVARNWQYIRGSVGGYLIEGEGVRLFDRVEGDTFTIQGLPLLPLLSWLTLRGSIPG
jgi:septum formation protein